MFESVRGGGVGGLRGLRSHERRGPQPLVRRPPRDQVASLSLRHSAIILSSFRRVWFVLGARVACVWARGVGLWLRW